MGVNLPMCGDWSDYIHGTSFGYKAKARLGELGYVCLKDRLGFSIKTDGLDPVSLESQTDIPVHTRMSQT